MSHFQTGTAADFDTLFRQWREANEAASMAEDALKEKLSFARLHRAALPERGEIDATSALRVTANRLMDLTLAAVTYEAPGFRRR